MGTLTFVCAVAAMAGMATLAFVDVVVWRRTARLRRGSAMQPARPPGSDLPPDPPVRRTGWSTHLAWVVGGLTVSVAAALVASGHPLGRLVAVAGGFVLLSGIHGRVASLEMTSRALVVRHWIRGPTVVPWGPGMVLRAPRAPPGGWQLQGAYSQTVLMPSDLLGREEVLLEVIRRANLRWDGRVWRGADGRRRDRPPSDREGGRSGRVRVEEPGPIPRW